MECRPGCGACCIAPSITTPLPKHPHGKPAGVRCLHLDSNHLCELFGSALRPSVCVSFPAGEDTCGASRQEALVNLETLERMTRCEV